MLAKDLFEPAGAMAVNDPHQERSAESGSIEVALERLERFVRSLPSHVHNTWFFHPHRRRDSWAAGFREVGFLASGLLLISYSPNTRGLCGNFGLPNPHPHPLLPFWTFHQDPYRSQTEKFDTIARLQLAERSIILGRR